MRDAFQRADLAATFAHPPTNMSAMTMSAALVAGKVSVTSKCVRETWRVACDARASIRHPRASRFTSPPRASSDDADIPASVARRRVARLCDPELTARRPPRSSRTRRSARKVQSSKSRCAERPLLRFRQRSLGRHRSETRLATDGEPGYPADLAARIARRDERASRCGRGETARRAASRVVRGGDGTRASSLPGPRSTGAHTLGVEKHGRDLDGPGGFVCPPPKKNHADARRTRT